MRVARTEWQVIMPQDFVLSLVELGRELELPCTALLEGQERDHERSYVGFGAGWVIKHQRQTPLAQDPMAAVRTFMQEQKEELGKEWRELESGVIGYVDSEWGLHWHKPASASFNPGYFFRLCPVNLILLPLSNRLVLEVFGEDEGEVSSTLNSWRKQVEQLVETINEDIALGSKANVFGSKDVTSGTSSWQSNMNRENFITMVAKIKEYIKSGDVFQVVYSQRFSKRGSYSPWAVYRKLRSLNPSPYLFCLEGEGETLVGSSPELLVSSIGARIRTCPIAGTRPRGGTEEADRAYEDELRRDEKENAEHAMLVDLGRNDLGRVSRYGSVQVTQYAEVERFSHVMHLVSTVEGELAAGHDGLAALQAAFPAGTLSGAPKVRAMEILQELEPGGRGAYGGALGILRWNGDVDFCITIRTLRLTRDEVSVQAGAGIVFDSVPEMEYEETVHKAKALMKVVDELAPND